MLVNFVKMHGLGNDFVVIDLITQSVRLHSAQIRRIADRNLGIGCDQVLLIEPPIHKDSDFFYRIYNADGHEVEQCGNGARCCARFFYDAGFANNTFFKADCLGGTTEFSMEADETVTMTFQPPVFEPKEIPFITAKEANTYPLTLDDTTVEISVVSLGNPHAVLVVPNVDTAAVKKLGPLIAKHPAFPNQTNVEFMQIVDRHNIRLRVWERGVGETFACGTGAAAAAICGIRLGILKNPVSVQFPFGHLVINFADYHSPIKMTGEAQSVFIGRFRL